MIIILMFEHEIHDGSLPDRDLKNKEIELDNISISKLHKRLTYLKNLIEEMHGKESGIINALQQPSKDLLVVRKPEKEMTYDDREYFDMSALCDGATLKLLVIVFSEYYEVEERKAFRQAWAKLKETSTNGNKELKWKTLFVIGRDYESAKEDWYHINEIILYHDLINIHSNHTKTMGAFYGALYWAQNACDYENMLIIRPNMIVNFERMYALLRTLKERGRRKDYFVRATVPANKTVQRSLYETSAWLASYETLGKTLPLLKHHSDSNEPINYTTVWNRIASTKRLYLNEFLSDPVCGYQERYIINAVPHYTCFYHIMDNFKTNVGNATKNKYKYLSSRVL